MFTRILLAACSAALLHAAAPGVRVVSPDGQVAIELRLAGRDGAQSRPVYRVLHRGKPVLLDSGLGITLDSGFLGASLAWKGVHEAACDRSWKPVYGERASIPENYREAVVALEETTGNRRRIEIAVRAYNEGAALRYTIPAQPALTGFTVLSEQTEFALPEGTRAWETHGAQQPYENVWVAELRPGVERPLVIEYPDGRYAALVEAGVRNYARMLFSPASGKPGTLESELSAGPAAPATAQPNLRGAVPFSTPWRAVIVADRPGQLLERNYLLLNLNEPAAGDYSWVKPGKAIREVTLSTRGARECVDFARRRNLQYVEFDAGWYGHEYDDASDATSVKVDPQRLQQDPAYQGLNLEEAIGYARRNGVGVLLYVNRRALERQLSTVLPLYEKWGVQGVKFGFVNVGNQYWTKWLYDAVELAGKHRLIVDIHDEHRPTGLSRTYPYLLTQEGIAGNETMPTPDLNTVLPFTRMAAGAADYTFCYYTGRIKTTRAHQLALAAVYYSPLQFLYWYDRPADYQGEPELEFWDHVKTVWDDTRVLDGRIGRYISVARRSGDEWFVGTINNSVPRRLSLRLDFLPAGRTYLAHFYEDGKGGPREVRMRTTRVTAESTVEAALPSGGGQAVWLEPAAPDAPAPAQSARRHFGDERDWFLRKRFGMFIHWGVYSVGEWHEQEMYRRKMTRAEYRAYVERFNPVRFNPDEWLDLAAEAGMDYLTFTTKHIDGFAMWDTAESSFNIMNTPYKRDILKMLADACHRRGFPLSLYYSIVDEHHPNYPNLGRPYELAAPGPGDQPDEEKYIASLLRQVRELLTKYGPIHGFWWDANSLRRRDPSVNAMIRSLAPAAVINNRGFDEGDFGTPERDFDASLDTLPAFDKLTEACQSVGYQSWGYRAGEDYYSDAHLIASIQRTLAKGGNYLLNVGPKPDGTIPDEAAGILRRIGAWYRGVKESLVEAEPAGKLTTNRDVLLTRRGKVVYVHLFKPLDSTSIVLPPMTRMPRKATLMNTGEAVACDLPVLPRLYNQNPNRCLRLRLNPRGRPTVGWVVRLEFDGLEG